MIKVKVLFFASARELAGNLRECWLEFNDTDHSSCSATAGDSITTNAVRKRLAQDYPRLASLVLDPDSMTLALNEEYVEEECQVHDGDTIALIPPISGG